MAMATSGPQEGTKPDFTYAGQNKGLGIIYDKAQATIQAITVDGTPKKLGPDDKDFKVTVLKITPTDPTQKPFIYVLYHGASGSTDKDKKQRRLEWAALQVLMQKAMDANKDCDSIVLGGDINMSLYTGKEDIPEPKRTSGKDYVINPLLKDMGVIVGGADLKLEGCALASHVIKKTRIKGNLWLNQQATKGGTVDEDTKSGQLLFRRREAPVDQAQAEKDMDALIASLQIPDAAVRVFGENFTEGGDHAVTQVLKVNGIEMDARPLIGTAGDRGTHKPETVYTRELTETDLTLMEESSAEFLNLLKDAIYKQKPELKAEGDKITDFIQNAEFIEKYKDLLVQTVNGPEIDKKSDKPIKVLTPESEALLTAVLKAWVTSEKYKLVNKLLIKPEIKGEEDISKILKAIGKKGKDIPATVAECFKSAQVSAGFAPVKGEEPRKAQIEALKNGKTTITIVTENDNGSHDNLDADMRTVTEGRNAAKAKAASSYSGAGVGAGVPGGSTSSGPSTATTDPQPPVATPAVKSKFPTGIVAAFAVLGAAIGAGVAIAVLGLAWPVAVAAVATGIVFGVARAIYAKATERTLSEPQKQLMEAGRSAMPSPTAEGSKIAAPKPGAEVTPPVSPPVADASKGTERRPSKG